MSSCHHDHSAAGGALELALRRLQEAGLKKTEIRQLILDYLTRSHGPFTVEEIHAGIKNQQCNLVTVYRSLASLEEAGLVRKYEIGDRVARFEYLCQDHPHHHLICTACKKVEVLEIDILHSVRTLADQKGFRKLGNSVDIFGLCDECV